MADDYKVGYGKPPKSTRFKKGQSGNAKGRPRGSQNLATVFHKIGREVVKVQVNGRTRKLYANACGDKMQTVPVLHVPGRYQRRVEGCIPEPPASS